MLHSAIDPALLVYDEEHWRTEQKHFFDRLGVLTLHRRFLRKHGQRTVTSYELVSILSQSFPWKTRVSELQDLRQFILEDWTRAEYLESGRPGSIILEPDDLTCRFVDDPAVLDAWKKLLLSCANEQQSSEFDAQVATWNVDDSLNQAQSLTITVESESHRLPLVWNEEGWAKQLASQDAWPNLHNCVLLYFTPNPSMRNYVGVRDQPIPFQCTDSFQKSIEDIGQKQLQQALVKAIAKRVYGVLDAGLHDEPFGEMRRFKVTDFWRVNYRDFGDSLLLEEFGPHDIGM